MLSVPHVRVEEGQGADLRGMGQNRHHDLAALKELWPLGSNWTRFSISPRTPIHRAISVSSTSSSGSSSSEALVPSGSAPSVRRT